MRCVLDGIQFSSGCTMGKGNIAMEPAEDPAVRFSKGGATLLVTLKPGWRARIDAEMSKEREVEQALFYYEMPEADLFDIIGPEPSTLSPTARTTRRPGSRRRAAVRRRRP